MKTNDFKVVLMQLTDKLNQRKLGEVLNYKFVETEDELAICANALSTKILSVIKKKENYFYYVANSGMGLDSEEIVSFTKKLMDYVATPVAEREDNEPKKRWRIHLIGELDTYLNLDTKENCYFLSDKDERRSCQTKFTRSEIEEWAGNDSDEIIDLIIDKFGEEVE